MPNSRSFGRQRHHFVDPMEPAPLFNNPRADYTQVVNLDEFRIPDLDHSPVINTCWDLLGVPEAKGNDDHVCPSMPPEAVRDDHDDKHQYARRAHDHQDEAVRLPFQGLMNAPGFHTFPQPLDTWWQSLGRQQGRDFAQRDAVCNVGDNYVDDSVNDTCQEHFIESDIEVSSQEQRPITIPSPSATTTVNIDGVDLRQHKQNPVIVTNSTPPRRRCIANAVVGLRKTVNAQLKRKAPTARCPASQRRTHILLERERRLAMSVFYDTLRELLHLENSEISARTDKATVVLEATNRIVSLEARVEEMLEELKKTRRSRNSSPANLPPATATATAPAPALPNLVRPQSYLTANVRLHVSGLGQVWINIHSPEEARQLRHRLLELVTTVIASRSHLDIVHLNVSRVGFTRFYTLHCQTTPGSVLAVDELHTTLQMVVNSELVRMQQIMTVTSNSAKLFKSGTSLEGYTMQL